MSTPLRFQYDTHKDCTPCASYESGPRCEHIGTGLHEPIDQHLQEQHGYSKDKVDGLRVASLVTGVQDVEIMVLAHQAILLFAPHMSILGHARRVTPDA